MRKSPGKRSRSIKRQVRKSKSRDAGGKGNVGSRDAGSKGNVGSCLPQSNDNIVMMAKSNWVWVPCVPERANSMKFFEDLTSGVVETNFEGQTCMVEMSEAAAAEALIKALIKDEIYACAMAAPPGSSSPFLLVKELPEEADNHRYFKKMSKAVERADIAVSKDVGRFCIITAGDNASAKELRKMLKENGMTAELITKKAKETWQETAAAEKANANKGRSRSRSRRGRGRPSPRRRNYSRSRSWTLTRPGC